MKGGQTSPATPTLVDRVVAVTGAGRGVGREHALLLAECGARVVVNDLGVKPDGNGADATPAAEVVADIERAGGTAVASGDDISTWEGAERLIAQAINTFGQLDALVNNAGVLRDAALVNLSEDDWQASLRINLLGHVAPARAAARHWRQRAKAGEAFDAALVNTSSESGVFANAGQTAYAAAKAGVASLTEVWAKELGRYGVRVNAILPRARTRLTESGFSRPATDGADFDRWDPANVAPFVAHLVDPTCTFTAEVFLVAGGLVQRARPWELDASWVLHKDGRWVVGELADAARGLGPPDRDGRDTGLVRRHAR